MRVILILIVATIIVGVTYEMKLVERLTEETSLVDLCPEQQAIDPKFVWLSKVERVRTRKSQNAVVVKQIKQICLSEFVDERKLQEVDHCIYTKPLDAKVGFAILKCINDKASEVGLELR